MFSETRYALNGELRVAYRTSREGPPTSWSSRIVHVRRGISGASVHSRAVEAMTSLGRLIFFDEPGTGASDPVTPGALPTLEQWADILAAAVL